MQILFVCRVLDIDVRWTMVKRDGPAKKIIS